MTAPCPCCDPPRRSTSLRAVVPIRTVSVANTRTHWAVKAKRVKTERAAVSLLLRPLLRDEPAGAWVPCVVTLTRIAPRALDDDNCVRAMKACRDAIAAELGIDDRDPRVTWRYAQRRGRVREHAVDVCLDRGAR